MSPVLSMRRNSIRGAQGWLGWELFGNRAIRQGNWKSLWLCTPFGPNQWQLYDLAADPGETTDLAERKPKLRDLLVKRWAQYVQNNNVILPDTSPLCRTDQ